MAREQTCARLLLKPYDNDWAFCTENETGGRPGADWHVKLSKTSKAKYIKLGLTEKQYLDLKYVFVYSKQDACSSRTR